MIVPGVLAGERVDRVVSMLCDVTRARAADLITAGQVLLDGHPVATRSRRVVEGDVIEVAGQVEVVVEGPRPDPSVEVAVVFADDDVIVVDKPAGLVVHPGAGRSGGTLVNGLLTRFPELAEIGQPDRPGVVHRLDAGTSGLLAVARSARAYTSLVAQLAGRTVDRSYDAMVWGHMDSPAGVIDAPVGRAVRNPTQMAVTAAGREARTHFKVVESFSEPELDRVSCRLETGRTHQIRVHFAAVGHPVVGDERYGGGKRAGRSGPAADIGRPFLHARELGFDHPVTGERLRFESPLPADLVAVIEALSAP